VLWLFEGGSSHSAVTCRRNLLSEAEKRDVSPERLIFAGKTNLADHLARHRHADLFLDTLPYNAHTTASDALWAGLPVITCLGSSFAGRVAASLLKAAGLSELVTSSLEEYEALALELARNPSRLASLKSQLARNRDSCSLFDTARSARAIEAAYLGMWHAHQSGRPPASFAVPDEG
jgi:protein O-GlcNAc transferase